jgi:glycosyltransferase 2 family protein
VLLAVSWVSFALLLLLPLRAGEIFRPVLLGRRSSVKAWEAAGTIGAERIVDGLTLSATLFVALKLAETLKPLPREVAGLPLRVDAVPAAAYGMFGFFTAAFCVMALFYWRRELARRLTRAVVGLLSRRLADTLSDIVERLASGLRFLPDARHSAPFLAETVLFWALNVVGVWLCGYGTGLDNFTMAQAAVTLGCIGIGVLVPSGPGFFGVFQLSSYLALSMFFPQAVVTGEGAAFVFVLYLGQVGVHLVCAFAGLALDPKTRLAEEEQVAREEGAAPG